MTNIPKNWNPHDKYQMGLQKGYKIGYEKATQELQDAAKQFEANMMDLLQQSYNHGYEQGVEDGMAWSNGAKDLYDAMHGKENENEDS